MTTRSSRAVLAAFAVLLAAAVPLSAQEAAADWYVDKPIKDFTFTGLVTVKEADLKAVLKQYIGQKFSQDSGGGFPLLTEMQDKLYALDYFDSIEPNAVPGDDAKTTLIINFTVKEHPSIVSIDVTGNATVRAGEITDKILLKKGDLANNTRLKADVEAVRSLYLDKGYSDVSVSASFVPADKDNTVRAVFTVVEGTPTTIKEIHFSGNTFASESTLRGLMKTKAQFLFDSGVFQESKLEEDKASIVSYYNDHGFVDAAIEKVTRDVQSQGGRNYLVLTLYVKEGDQWNFGGLKFSGNQVFSTDTLSALVYQKPGKTLSMQKLQADIGRVQELYQRNGYIFNQFARDESRDAATHTITYTLKITETDKAHIESIIFKGNTKTKESVLRRGLPFEEGDVFDAAKFVQGYQYLQNLQYFKTVAYDLPTGSAFGLINVVFTVEETSTADINFGIVFSGGDFPVSGTIKWNERNFQGKGQTVGVDLEASPIKQIVALNFYEPWMFGVPWSGGLSVSLDHELQQNVLQDILPPIFGDGQTAIAAPDPYATRQDYLNALASGATIPSQYLMSYDSFNLTFGANTGYTFTFPFGRLSFTGGYTPQLRYVNYDQTLYRPFEENVRDNNKTWNFIDRVAMGTTLDGRDIYWNPTKGYLASQNFTFVGGILFGSRDYIRTDTTLEGFLTIFDIPVTEGWDLQLVAAAHSSLSMILPNYALDSATGTWGWQTKTDYTDQLYIDGMTVGRGWRQLYGNALWDNKFELRMPIIKEAIWLVGFFDAAALWDTPFAGLAAPPATSIDQASIDQFYFSFGFGIRFTIPQFPIRLYLAKGFRISNGAVDWSSFDNIPGHLSIGGVSFGFVISLGGDVF